LGKYRNAIDSNDSPYNHLIPIYVFSERWEHDYILNSDDREEVIYKKLIPDPKDPTNPPKVLYKSKKYIVCEILMNSGTTRSKCIFV
jgi:hypothetical protein